MKMLDIHLRMSIYHTYLLICPRLPSHLSPVALQCDTFGFYPSELTISVPREKPKNPQLFITNVIFMNFLS